MSKASYLLVLLVDPVSGAAATLKEAKLRGADGLEHALGASGLPPEVEAPGALGIELGALSAGPYTLVLAGEVNQRELPLSLGRADEDLPIVVLPDPLPPGVELDGRLRGGASGGWSALVHLLRVADLADTPSLRLDPNVFVSAATVTVRPEHLPAGLLGKTLTLDLVEKDGAAQGGDLMARFEVTLAAVEGGGFHFASATRQSVPADVADDMQLPGPAADTSRDGKFTYPFTTTWQRVHLKLVFHGQEAEHLVIVRVASARDRTQWEGMIFEVGLLLRGPAEGGAAGEVLFDTGAQTATLDGWDALVTNCAAAAKTIHDGHEYLVGARGQGDYYGSHSGQTNTSGKKATDCITYALQSMERGYQEARCWADSRYVWNNAKNGTEFAQAMHDLGWGLVLFVRDVAELKSWSPSFEYSTYLKAKSKKTLLGRPLFELVADYGRSEETPESWAAKRRYDELTQVPFGVCALGLGSHVVMKVGPEVYECHWGRYSSDAGLFDKVGLSWENLRYNESIFYLAGPIRSLRPPAIEKLETIKLKSIPVQLPAPRLIPLGLPSGG